MDSALGYLKASDYLRELEGKIALVKSDFNVPIISDGGSNQRIADAFRILQAAPFIRELINAGVIPLLVTHLGRPKGYDPALTLDPISTALSGALKREVEIIRFAPEKGTFSPAQFNVDYMKELFNAGIIQNEPVQ